MDEADIKREEACRELELAASQSNAITASLAAADQVPPADLDSRSYQWVVARYQAASSECMCGPLIVKRREASTQVIEADNELADLEEERRITAVELAAKGIELVECALGHKAVEVALCVQSKQLEIVALTKKLQLLDRQIVRAKRKLAKAWEELNKALAAEAQCTALRRITISVKYDLSDANGSTRATGKIDFERGVLTGATSLLTVNGVADQTSTTVMIAKGTGMYICYPPSATGGTTPSDGGTGSLSHGGGTVPHHNTWSSWDQSFLAVAEVRVKDIATRRLRLGVLPFKDTKLKYAGDGCIPVDPIDPLLRAVFTQTMSAVPGSLPYTVDFRLPEKGDEPVEAKTVQTFKAPYSGTATWSVRVE